MIDQGEAFGAPRRRGRGGALLLVLLAFAAGVALMAYGVHRWDSVGGWLRPASSAAKPAMAPLPVAPVPAPHSISPDPELTERVNDLDEKVQQIDGQAREANGNADRAEGLLVAFAARRLIDRGQALGYLETMLRDHFGGTEPRAVAMIIAAGQRPVTIGGLEQGFATVAPLLVATPPKESWWTGFRREMGTLFVIRRAEVPSTLPEDRRARAQAALDRGDVETTLTEVARTPGAAHAGDWIAAARRYVMVHNALDRIETAALLAPPPAKAQVAALQP